MAQQTERIKAVIRAEQEKQVAEITAETLKKVSEIGKKIGGSQIIDFILLINSFHPYIGQALCRGIVN